jgi:hypothetical protein
MNIDIQKKKQALLDTRKLWTRIKEHPELSKQNAAEFLGMGNQLYYCPCCEYSIRDTMLRCDKSNVPCPLFDYAWPRQDRGCCVSESSPYYLYNEAIRQARSYADYSQFVGCLVYPITHEESLRDIVIAATRIIEACDKALLAEEFL